MQKWMGSDTDSCCDLVSVRILTYILFFYQYQCRAGAHPSNIHTHSASTVLHTQALLPLSKANGNIHDSFKHQHIMYGAMSSQQTDCLTPHIGPMATASLFCCSGGTQDIFRCSRVSHGRGHEFTVLCTQLYNLLCTVLPAPVMLIS